MRGGEGALRREGADVQFVEDELVARRRSSRRRSRRMSRVDHLRRAVDALGLKARRRIGKGVAAVDAVAVPCPGGDAGNEAAEGAIREPLQRRGRVPGGSKTTSMASRRVPRRGSGRRPPRARLQGSAASRQHSAPQCHP